jgi:hypothetical protein
VPIATALAPMIEMAVPKMTFAPKTSCSGLSHIAKNKRNTKVDCSSGITADRRNR